MKCSVYDGAEFTTQGNNKRVDPYHPLADKILRLGCVNLNLGEVHNHSPSTNWNTAFV